MSADEPFPKSIQDGVSPDASGDASNPELDSFTLGNEKNETVTLTPAVLNLDQEPVKRDASEINEIGDDIGETLYLQKDSLESGASSLLTDDVSEETPEEKKQGESVFFKEVVDVIPGSKEGVNDSTSAFADAHNMDVKEVEQADKERREALAKDERVASTPGKESDVAGKNGVEEEKYRHDAELDNFRIPLEDPDGSDSERPRIELELECSASDPVPFTASLLERLETLTFRAARVDTDYDFSYRIQDDGQQIKIKRFKARGFAQYGLVCVQNDGDLHISGKPVKPYEGMIDLVIDTTCKVVRKLKSPLLMFKGKFEVERREVSRPFLINPDPWTLWEEHEPDPGLPYQKKEHGIYSCGAIPADPDAPLAVLAASQRGRSHAHNALFRDDDFKFELAKNPGEWSFFAVADGAGSAKFSRKGSEIACKQTIDLFSQIFNKSKNGLDINEDLKNEIQEKVKRGAIDNDILLDEDAIKRVKLDQYFYMIVREVYNGIGAVAEAYNATFNAAEPVSHKDFSTTLLCAALRRFEATETAPPFWVVVSYWVGDGGMAIDRPNGKPYVQTLGEPDGGEFAGQTRFVTMRDQIDPQKVAKRVRVAVVQNFKALVLMTDGISDPFFPAEDDLANYEFWEQFWSKNMPEHLPGVLDESRTLEDRAKALLDGLMFKVKGNHDDRTLLLVFGKDAPANDVDSSEEAAQTSERNACEDSDATTSDTDATHASQSESIP